MISSILGDTGGCTYHELPLVVLEEEGRVGLGGVLVAGGIHAGHEVVVEVVIAAHADREDAPVQVAAERRPIPPKHPRHLLHRRAEVLHLVGHGEVVALQLFEEMHPSKIQSPCSCYWAELVILEENSFLKTR